MDEESKIEPEREFTVQEFVALAKNLLDEMLEEHYGSTGIETQYWHEWFDDLLNAYLNN
jgi:hypothetical protein